MAQWLTDIKIDSHTYTSSFLVVLSSFLKQQELIKVNTGMKRMFQMDTNQLVKNGARKTSPTSGDPLASSCSFVCAGNGNFIATLAPDGQSAESSSPSPLGCIESDDEEASLFSDSSDESGAITKGGVASRVGSEWEFVCATRCCSFWLLCLSFGC